MQHHFLNIGVSVGFSDRVHRALCAFHVTYGSCVSSALSLFPLGSCFLKQVMTDSLHPRLPFRVSTTTLAHNMWNPLLELLFLKQANGIFASYLPEIDLAKIALSCHFALVLLCYEEEVLASAR